MARFLHTLSLFFETATGDKANVRYTLKPDDHNGYPSLHKLYLQESDPTEHSFATKYLLGWDHWEALLGSTWFADYISLWRRDLHAKIASESFAKIKTIALGGNDQNSLNASKYLLETLGKATGSLKHRKTKNLHADTERDILKSHAAQIEKDFDRIKGLQ